MVERGDIVTSRLQRTLLVLLTLVWQLLPATVSGQESAAQRTISQATSAFYQSLEQQQQSGKLQADKLHTLVSSILIPHADFKAMSIWVLGRHWQQATPEQQQRFVAAFRQLLIRTYAASVQLASLEQIQYLPERATAKPGRAVVRTEIRRPGEPVVSIDYYLHLRNEQWKVFDVRLEGVSLICNYRSTFGSEIANHGLANLIAKLEKKNSE